MRIESFLKQSPIFQTSRIARTMDGSLNLLLREEGVTAFEALVLAALFFEKKGGVKPSALAEAFQTTRGNVSHCISSLEAKGLVQRQIDPEDARAFQLGLQPQGRRRAVRVVGILDRMQRGFEEEIGVPELEAMLDRMRAVEVLCSRMARAGQSSGR
ncbi:MarR family winged helix-turn-helix transcriptional regulator [Granulicella arctica]|uniref:DNA-binding MarR family transcriptional regulator n=1 Tax=Granulicella arctica TaxID=940613 RepID=A0A7Y9TJH1_9BACT|nr:MarR family winged helix-turn-helix transcriptional regulator [Granulicella arctica]NYF78267.1 DNA-binding MarR family transcriptional regulator [Granulicella arctica]